MAAPRPQSAGRSGNCPMCRKADGLLDVQRLSELAALDDDLCSICEELYPDEARCCEFAIVWGRQTPREGGPRA